MKKVTRISFKIINSVINRKVLLIFSIFFFVLFVSARQEYIKGTIFGENHIPLLGAVVIVNNGQQTLISNGAGEFAISNIEGEFTVQVQFLGYQNYNRIINTDTLSGILKIQLNILGEKIDEIAVNGKRSEMLNRKESICVQLVEEGFLKERNAGSLMQSLSSIPGISSMDIGAGLSKPVIRGLGYYRVVLAQNGIKQEGQQWSSHHGSAVAGNLVNHVEVIKGTDALQYGSDAIGGVINILPYHVPLDQEISGNITVYGKSNNQNLGANAEVNARRGDLYTNFALSYQKYNDFTVPATDSFLYPSPAGLIEEQSHKDPLGNTVYNTAGDEKALAFVAGIIKTWGNSYFDINFYDQHSGFFDWMTVRNDSLVALHRQSTSDIRFPSQKMQHVNLNHFTNIYKDWGKLRFSIGFQNNHTSEYSYLTDLTGNRQEAISTYGNLDLDFKLQTYTANAYAEIVKQERHTIKFGVSNQLQYHVVDGYNHLLPNYSRLSSGGFVSDIAEINSKLFVNTGLRFDIGRINLEETLNPDPAIGDSVFNNALTRVYPATTLSTGMNYKPSAKWMLLFSLGNSFRLPSIYELASSGFHRHEARYLKGDIELNPEKAWQINTGMQYFGSDIKFMLHPFMYYFTNYIYLKPTAEFKTGSYTGQVYTYTENKAMLTGGEFSAEYQPIKKLKFTLGTEYVYAVNLDLKTAIPATPPFSVNSTINFYPGDFHFLTNTSLGIENVYAAAQKYTVPNELETPGYMLFNLITQTSIKVSDQEFKLYLQVHNLFDTRYYNHLSFYRRLRIPEQGRNIILTLSYSF